MQLWTKSATSAKRKKKLWHSKSKKQSDKCANSQSSDMFTQSSAFQRRTKAASQSFMFSTTSGAETTILFTHCWHQSRPYDPREEGGGGGGRGREREGDEAAERSGLIRLIRLIRVRRVNEDPDPRVMTDPGVQRLWENHHRHEGRKQRRRTEHLNCFSQVWTFCHINVNCKNTRNTRMLMVSCCKD